MSGAVTEAGTATRMTRCEKHNFNFPQVSFPAIPGAQDRLWVGGCERCNKDAETLSKARQLAEESKSEIFRRAQTQMQQCEASGEIATSTDLEIEEYFEKVRSEVAGSRSEWEADVRRRIWEQLILDAESEVTAEFVEQLKGAK